MKKEKTSLEMFERISSAFLSDIPTTYSATEVIARDLKALQIITLKYVNLGTLFVLNDDLETYNEFKPDFMKITKEEYDFLKEWFKQYFSEHYQSFKPNAENKDEKDI